MKRSKVPKSRNTNGMQSERISLMHPTPNAKLKDLQTKNDELTQKLAQLRAKQLKLIESEKRSVIGTLSAGLAHEINNPLNYIRGGIHSLKTNMEDIINLLVSVEEELRSATQDDGVGTTEKLRLAEILSNLQDRKMSLDYDWLIEESEGIFHSVDEGVKKTAEITKSLRTLGSFSSDELVVEDITKDIDATLILLNRHLQDVSVVKFYQTIPKIEYAPAKMSQVFLNVVRNSLEAMNGGERKIVITCSPSTDGFIKITISDYGAGIPEDFGQKIFDPFFTTKPVGDGSGLGLAIAKSIVEDHKGRIYYESAIRHGSSFYIELPIRQDH